MTRTRRQREMSSALRRLRFAARLTGGIVAALIITAIAAVILLSTTATARLVPVLSNSMAPAMPVGSLALTLPVARADIAVGDVIVFSDPNRPSIRVIHRVVHIYGADEAHKFSNWKADEFIASTKGDNNATVDPWTVTIADPIIWRLSRSANYLGLPAIWFQTPTIRLWGFSIVGVLFITWMLVVVWRRPPANADNLGASDVAS